MENPDPANSDNPSTGDITVGDLSHVTGVAIGHGARATVNQVFQTIIHHPEGWQTLVWKWLLARWLVVAVFCLLQAFLAIAHWKLRHRYLISDLLWFMCAVLLAAATVGWYGLIRKQKHLPVILTALISTGLLVAVFSWQAYRITHPARFDENTFGIAVAELGDGPGYHRSTISRELTDQIYEYLCRSLENNWQQVPDATCAEHMTRLGVIINRDQAVAYSTQNNATVMLWGQLLRSREGYATIHFEFFQTLDAPVNLALPLVLVINPSVNFYDDLEIEANPEILKKTVTRQTQLVAEFVMGLQAYLTRRYPLAEKHFRVAISLLESEPLLNLEPEGTSLLYYYLGRVLVNLGNFENGMDWLLSAHAINPDEAAIPLSIAIGYGSLGQTESRDEYLEKALRLLNLHLQTHPQDAKAHYDRGIIYQIHENHMAAIAEFQGIIQDDPQFYVAYLSLSNSLHELKRYSEAKTILEDAIRVFEAHGRNAAWAHINLARLYEKLAENELARKEYQVSLELDTDEIWFYSYYAQFLEARSEKDAALLTYLAMARVAEENGWNIGWAYSSLANFYRQMGMLEEALKSYQKAVGDQPENALLRSFLAETYFGLGEADAAVAEYEAALALEEDVYFVFASYAGVLFQMGNLDRAAEMYRKSLELRPVDYAVLLNLGQVYQQQGKISDARQVYQTVLSYADRFPAEVIQIAAQRLAELGEP